MAIPASKAESSKLNLSKKENKNDMNTPPPSNTKTTHRGNECLLKIYRAFDRDNSIHFGKMSFIFLLGNNSNYGLPRIKSSG